MEVFHLSHTDLDGYGCQLITNELFKNINFYNANYGEEVTFRLNQIIDDIEKSEHDDVMVLITDLNLTLDEAKKIDKMVKDEQNTKNVTLQLLDHHASGLDCAKKYPWYLLDTSRCASKITYDYMNEKRPKKLAKTRWLKPMIDMINAIDIWLEDEKYFEFGKVAMRLVNETRELNRFMFDKEHRDYKLKALKWSAKYLGKSDGHIKLDDDIIKLKKKYLSGEENDILDNHISKYIGKLLADKKEELKIQMDGKIGILTYNLGSISTIANQFLKDNKDIDFFMDINGRGNCSFRAAGAIDLSQSTKKYFNGGGHPNASGGRIEGLKDTFLYNKVKEQVENILKEKQNG